MISFRYVSECDPPAPFVNVAIAHPMSPQRVKPHVARIDSAADRTVVPLQIAQALSLQPSRELPFEGLGGHIERLPLFLVFLQIQGLTAIDIEVAAHPAEPFVLLGRDRPQSLPSAPRRAL